VYTGVPRLAKYLLQSVLRNWAHRDSITCDLFDRLYQTAENMKRALLAGNIDSVGKLLTEYWNQKRLIAQGSDTEPLRVSEMMSKLKSLIFGYSLAGAGGGGFVILITRDPNMMPEIKSLLEDEIENQGASIHSIKIDRLGWTEQEKSID
jgi:fucokinase